MVATIVFHRESNKPASADTITLNLANSVQTGAAGSTLSFDATVTAPGNNGTTIYLNGDNFTSLASPLTSNDDGFLLGFPLSLDPGESFSGLLFTITLPSNNCITHALTCAMPAVNGRITAS